MAEGERLSLLEQAIQIKKAAELRQLDKMQAAALLPGFKIQLAVLIASKVPPPKIITNEVGDFDHLENDREKLATRLQALVPYEEGRVEVLIAASGYPKLDAPDIAAGLDFEVDVKDLDSKLSIHGEEAIIKPKSLERQRLSLMTPEGKVDGYMLPASRLALTEDLKDYDQLLQVIKYKKGVRFKGSTPPIIQRKPIKMNLPPMRPAYQDG